MPLVLGIDEAGYGPMLGPLVVAGSLFRTGPALLRADWWNALGTCLARSPARGDWRFTVNDSKQAFDRRKGLHTLERTVLAFAAAAGGPCDSLAALLTWMCPDAVRADAFPWYGGPDLPLPLDIRHSNAPGATARLTRELAAADVQCLGLLAELVTEDRFNQRVRATRNKAAVLLEHVLRLVGRAAARCGHEDMLVRIDRLGGRTDYRRLLAEAFPEREIHVVEVSDAGSRYRLAAAGSIWCIEFSAEADRQHLPVALASMTAKYLRELHMQRFNAWWRRWLPDLRPTAGYYTDAQRFLEDIRPAIARCGLSPECFVRLR